MKRILILGALLIAVLFIGWAEWPGTGTIKGDKTFEDSTTFNGDVVHTGTVTFAPGWMELDQIKPATNDSASSSLGTTTNPYAVAYIQKIYPKTVRWDLLQDNTGSDATASGAAGDICGSLNGATADSVIIDSLCVLWRTNHNDVYIDSMLWIQGSTRSTFSTTAIYGNGTDVGAGTATYTLVTYTPAVTVSSDWHMMIQYWVATSATAGTGYIYSAKVYGHYK